jgi:glycosyltransferase involved in cell wall biosynthesis
MTSKQVSVIIPAYNCAPYLEAAIQSALDQTYPNIEVVVVNDGSPDDTDKVVQPFLDRIFYVKQENKGLSGARNSGFQASHGEFVCFLDADDTLFPDKFTKQMAVFEREPDLGVVISGHLDIAADGKTIICAVEKHWHRDALEHLLNHVVFPVHAALIRRDVLDEKNPFPEVVNRGEYQEDWQLWLDLALNGIQFSSVPEPTCRYWHRAGSGSSYPLKHFDGARRVVNWLRQHPKIEPYRSRVERLSKIVDMERVGRAWQVEEVDLAARELALTMCQHPAFWREPGTMLRLFTGSLKLEEQARWSTRKDIHNMEEIMFCKRLPSLKPVLKSREYHRLSAATWLAISDLTYAKGDHLARYRGLFHALEQSPVVCLSNQGLPSTLRGLLGPKVIGWLRSIQ